MIVSSIKASPVLVLLPVESCSSRAERFSWISITFRAVSSSVVNRWFSFRSFAASFWSWLAGGAAPEGRPSASRTARSRWSRHALINEVYRPSRRSTAPLPSRSHASYSARMSRLYFAVYVRRFALSGTCGSRNLGHGPSLPPWPGRC